MDINTYTLTQEGNIVEKWKQLEKQYLNNQTIKIGLKDLSLKNFKSLLEHASIKPMFYQATKDIDKEVVEQCIMQHIYLEIEPSNSKLEHLHQMEDIIMMEHKYQNTTKQIVKRYFYQKQLDTLQNKKVDFLLDKKEIEVLDTLYYWL